MVVVFGTICLDRLHKVSHLPAPGGYVEICESLVTLGGEACNTSLILNRWGVPVRLTGNAIGNDPASDQILQLLAHEGIETREIQRDQGLAPICDIYVTPDGERTMFGRGFLGLPSRCPEVTEEFTAGTWVTTDLNVGQAGRDFVLRARASGARVYWLDEAKLDEGQAGDVMQTSTDQLGTKGDIQANRRVVERWVAQTEAFCILSDGANGFVAGSRTLPVAHFPPYPCPEVVDATGAGDAFRAGMLCGLSQAWPLADCLRFASAAGCLNCRSLGATTQIPARDEIEELLASHPVIGRSYEIG